MQQSDAQSLAIAYREALCQSNLEFFRSTLPDIYQRLLAHPTTLQLTMGQDDALQVTTENFPTTPLITFQWWLQPIYKAFCAAATRQQFLAPIDPPKLDANSNYSDLQEIEAYYSPIDPGFRERFARQFAAHYPGDYPRTPYPVLGTDTQAIVLVLGISNGWHIKRLVEDYRVRHIVLVENDLDMLLLSLYSIDWREVYHAIRLSGRFFSISIETDIDLLGAVVTREIRERWPMFFTHGMGMISASPNLELARKVQSSIRDSFRIFMKGWGFFDDEVVSLKHAAQNLYKNWPTCQKTDVWDGSVPVVVVGSGPSLDGLLPTLSRIRDHVVILSCGTAITALEKAGIKPDFQLAMERTQSTATLMRDSASPDFLRSIPAIFPASIHPDLPALSDRPLMVGKLVDSGTLAFRTDGKFEKEFNTNPTVTNFGLEIAIQMGAREVYLFGVDFGYVDRNKHHSTQSTYHDDEFASEMISKVRDATEKMADESYEIPGNLRDTVLTHDFFDMARQEMEFFIRHRYTGKTIYNCNDGAQIKGATPLPPQDIALEKILAGPLKAQAVEDLTGAFSPPNLQKQIPARITALRENVAGYVKKINATIDRDIKTREQLWDAMADIYLSVNPETSKKAGAMLLSGSITHMLCQCFQVVTHDEDEEHLLKFAKEILGNLRDFLKEAERVIEVEIAGIRP